MPTLANTDVGMTNGEFNAKVSQRKFQKHYSSCKFCSSYGRRTCCTAQHVQNSNRNYRGCDRNHMWWLLKQLVLMVTCQDNDKLTEYDVGLLPTLPKAESVSKYFSVWTTSQQPRERLLRADVNNDPVQSNIHEDIIIRLLVRTCVYDRFCLTESCVICPYRRNGNCTQRVVVYQSWCSTCTELYIGKQVDG